MSRLFAALAAALLLAACEGGDIVIQPSTTDASVDNSTNNSNNTNTTSTSEDNPCAVYEQDGSTFEGQQVGANCVYSPSFADAGNNLTVNLRIPALADGGAHIFEGSLFVGRTHDTDEGLANAGITRGGDGPALTVEAGATIAFQSSADFLIINRGSQLFAVGTREAPITFTSVSDIEGSAGPEDVQQWGGMVINGFGVTNKCDYEGSAGSLTTSDCHVDAEGAAGLDESQYGGDNNEDSSGRLEYVVVKHTGATVGNGDELNGISFGGVGSNTIVKNLRGLFHVRRRHRDVRRRGELREFRRTSMSATTPSTWTRAGLGTITNALVIQSATDGNHCVEGDGIGSFDPASPTMRWKPPIRSRHQQPAHHQRASPASFPPNGVATATHDPGAGWRLARRHLPNHQRLDGDRLLRRGREPRLGRLQTTACVSTTARCRRRRTATLRINTGDLRLRREDEGRLIAEWHQRRSLGGGKRPTAPCSPTSAGSVRTPRPTPTTDLQLLEGTPPVYSIDYANDGRSTARLAGRQPSAWRPLVRRRSFSTRQLPTGPLAGPTASMTATAAQPLWFE